VQASRALGDGGLPDIAQLIILSGSGNEEAIRGLRDLRKQQPELFSGQRKVKSSRGEGFAYSAGPQQFSFGLASYTQRPLNASQWWTRWKGKRVADLPQVHNGWHGVSVDLSTGALTYYLFTGTGSPTVDAYFTVRNGVVEDIRMEWDVEPLPNPERDF